MFMLTICKSLINGGLEHEDWSYHTTLWTLESWNTLYFREICISKYNISNGGWEFPSVSYRASGIWKSVLSALEAFASSIRFCAFAGDRVRFWTDILCDSSSFRDRFPLYTIATNPHSTVFENYVYQGGHVV